MFFAFDSILDWYKTKVMCDRVVSEDPFLIVYCYDEYKTQRMCDEAVDDCLVALKFISDWFVRSKIIKNVLLLCSQMITYPLFGNAIFSCNEMGILNTDLNHINLDDTSHKEDDPEIIIHIRLLAGHIKFEKHIALKEKKNLWRIKANNMAS